MEWILLLAEGDGWCALGMTALTGALAIVVAALVFVAKDVSSLKRTRGKNRQPSLWDGEP